MEEVKIFSGGGLDSNTAYEGIAPNDYIDSEFIRTVTTEGSDGGYLVPMDGNEIRSNPEFQTGDKVRKAVHFTDINTTFVFIHNGSNGRIDEYNPKTKTFNTLISGSILGTSTVKDIKLADNKYLLWNNTTSEVKMINVERARNGEYSSPVLSDITLVKAQPTYHIGTQYVSEGDTNLIKGSLFQFRQQYIYEDDQASAWSPISERPVPETESGVGLNDENNGIRVYVDIGTPRVKEVVVAAREGNGDWFIINRKNRSEILDLPNITPAPGQDLPPEYRTAIFNQWIFLFRNDSLYEYVDVLETDLLADYVPKQAKALEVVNKNVVVLGSTLEGYPRPTTNAVLTPAVIPVGGGSGNTFDVYNWNTITQPPGTTAGTSHIDIQFQGGNPIAGTTVYATFEGRVNGVPETSFTKTYTFTPSDISAGIGTALINMLNSWKNSGMSLMTDLDETNNSIGWYASFNINSGWNTRYLHITGVNVINPSITSDIISTPTLKSKSSYRLALAHYDEFGRPFPITTHSNFEVTTPDRSGAVKLGIDWDISGQDAPVGAKSYRWLMTKNTRFANWVTTYGTYDSTKSSTGTMVFDITALKNFATDNEGTPVHYEYSEGDRVNIRWSQAEQADVTIRKVEVDGDRLYLYTEEPTDITKDTITFGYILTLYTPRKSGTDADTEVYYEVGEVYQIVDGDYTVTSGTITGGDAYLKKRIMNDGASSGTVIVEDPHFSEYYISNYYSYGRPRTYYDTPENYLAKARIRYSREFIKGDRVDTNNMSRFYGENYEDYDDIHGTICYLSVRQNRLICLQEKNIGYIGVYRQIIEDSVGQQNIAVSEKLLSDIEYTRGRQTGIGDALDSFVEYTGVVYFVDPDKDAVIKAGLNGVSDIGANYSNRIMDLLKTNKENSNTGNIKGYFNVRYSEYMLYIPEPDMMIVFSEVLDKWITTMSLNPDHAFSVDNSLYMAKDGQIWEDTEELKASYFGTQYTPSVTTSVNSNPNVVKTYHSLAIHSDKLLITATDGIETQLGHVSDLLEEDFTTREGIHYANFLRDKNTDLNNGDRLKGRWIKLKVQPYLDPDFKLLKLVVKSQVSTPNE